MVYSQAEHVFILKDYITSKSFVSLHKAFTNVFPGKEELNNNNTLTSNKISKLMKYLQQEICLALNSVDRQDTLQH
jgi:hypothetical protein